MNASLLMKLALAIGVLYFVRRADASVCAGAANGTACGPPRDDGKPSRICHTGNGYTNACLENGRWQATTTFQELGSSWLDPSTWGSVDEWASKFSEAFNGPTETPPSGPITSTNDPRLGEES